MLVFLGLVAAAAANPAQPAANPETDRIVCVRQNVGSEVGTHIRPKKVCMKQSDWDIVESHTKETLQTINQRGNNPGMAQGHGASPQ
jgi:hypothetical protein